MEPQKISINTWLLRHGLYRVFPRKNAMFIGFTVSSGKYFVEKVSLWRAPN